jgi:PAS domain S-box-containing protein
MHQLAKNRPAAPVARCVPDLPVLGRSLLEEALGAIPYRLYLAEGDGSMTLLLASRLELDPRDPWSSELRSPAVWAERMDADGVVAVLRGRDGLAAPDSRLRLRALRAEGRLCGGLLLRPAGGRLSRATTAALSEPSFEMTLAHTFELWSARRELQELRTFREGLAGTLPYGILVIDSLGRVTYMGGRAAEILGTGEAEVKGIDCARIFRPAGLQSHPLLDGLRRKLPPMELYVVRADGLEVPISLQMSRLSSAPGRSKTLIAFFQDLTEERALEEAERHRDRLAVLGELSAGVAHEIRNPLTGISNCAQVMQEELDPEDKGQRFLRIILDESARLNRIVEGLLRYARPNRPELRESSVEDCLRRALDLVRPGLEQKGIRVVQRVSGRIPKLYIDPGQIEQVLLNLLRNAEDAMPAGGEISLDLSIIRRRPHRRRGTGRRATDRVRVAPDGPLQRFAQVKVGDTGHGIPRDLLPRVFNPFFTTRTRGTGLGLSLCQSMVREHGGFLTIRSVEQKGTTVLLELPVERRHGERRKDPR